MKRSSFLFRLGVQNQCLLFCLRNKLKKESLRYLLEIIRDFQVVFTNKGGLISEAIDTIERSKLELDLARLFRMLTNANKIDFGV